MAAEILETAGLRAVMEQPDRVAGLMGARFRHELSRSAGASVDEARDVRLRIRADRPEGTDVGLTARTGGVLVRTEDDTHTVAGPRGASVPEVLDARIFGRHVYIKPGEILRHASPDILDGRMLRRAEGGRIGIKRERRGRESRLRESRVPRRVGGRVSVEIKVDLTGRGGSAMQLECLRGRVARRGGDSRDVGTDWRLQAGAHVKRGTTRCRDMQVVIAIAGLDEIFPGNTGDIRRLFPLGDAGEEGRAIERRGTRGGSVRRRTRIYLGRRLRGGDRLGRGGHGLGDAPERNRSGLGTLIGLRDRRDGGDHGRGDGGLRRHDDRASGGRDIDGGVLDVLATGRQEKDRTSDSQSEEACGNLELARGHKKIVTKPHRLSSRL